MRYTSFMVAGSIVLSAIGCTTVQGVERQPAEHRSVVDASGYSLAGCQAKMDKLAGSKVQMVSHTDQVAMSVRSLFLVPAYVCEGFVQEPGSSSSAPPAEAQTAK
jgi:hypothetical protein